MFLWLIILFFILGFVGSAQVIRQPRYQPAITPGDYELPWNSLNLLTSDQVSIAGWLLRHPRPKGILLLLHGFGTGKADLLDMARDLFSQGEYHIILIDFRGHGYSGGTSLFFGKRETMDIKTVLDFVSQDPSLRQLPIGCLGISMGASIGWLAGKQFQIIRAFVSDSAYIDLSKAVARGIWMSYHIPRFPLGQIVLWATEMRLGCTFAHLSPLRAAQGWAPRPVMIIHGMRDKTTPYQDAETLFKANQEPKKLWLVENSEHVGAFFTQREEYLNRVLRFFKDGLR